MVTTRPFKFENIVGTPVDITQFVTQVDSCKFQGSGKIRSLSLMLNVDGGAFLTNKDYLGTDFTPIINQFDKFEITWIDEAAVERQMIVEVDQELGQPIVLNGNTLPIEFKGREAALQRRKLTAFYQFKDPKFVIEDLIGRYNTTPGGIGTDEPAVLTTSGGTDFIETVPTNVVNIYDFTKEISYYDALMMVVRRLNQPVAQQGAGDFYSLVFTDGEDLPSPIANSIVLRCFVQGVGSAPNLESLPNDPFNSLTYQIHTESGNQILVRGQQGTGYQPKVFHEFNSFVEQINNYPVWSAQTYIPGIIVRGSNNSLYECDTTTTDDPVVDATDWTLKTPVTIMNLTDDNYSLWTNNKVAVTKNGMSNSETAFGNTFGSPAFWDGNLVIREVHNYVADSFVFWRDWAFVREINPSNIASAWLNFAGTGGLYNGFRVLVDTALGAVGGDFVGADKFGRTFADALVLYNGDEWIVIRQFNNATINQLGDQVAVLEEGIMREWNVPLNAASNNDYANAHTHGSWNPKQRGPGAISTMAWRDVSQTMGGNDPFHHPSNIESVDGLFPAEINGDDYSTFISGSALKVTFEFELDNIICGFLDPFVDFFDDPLGKLIDLFDAGDDGFETQMGNSTTDEQNALKDASYYDFGWWYTLSFPYPLNTFNSISEKVGDLYGAAPGAMQKRDFAALDIQNANYSHIGQPGFNHDNVEDMGGPFTGLSFYFLFDIFLNGSSKPFAGDVNFIATIYDDLSTVWRADFTVRFLGDAQLISIGFDEFTVDRPSRTPWGLRTAFQNIVTPELEIRSIFEPKRARFISLALGDAYDDNLRYLPVNIENVLALGYGLGTVTFEGTIDALALTKQPFTSSGIITDRTINPETIQMPNTRNLLQLRSVATAIKQLHELQFEQYNVITDLDNSLTVEQSVMLVDSVFVKNSPRKLVVMVDEASWHETGPKAGAKSTRVLTRRLNA